MRSTSRNCLSRFHLRFVFIALLAAPHFPLGAATFDVTDTGGTGPGTLHQALTDAAGAGAGPHIVTAETLSGTISLTTDLPAIVNSVEIRGPGASRLAIGANLDRRALTVSFGAQLSVGGLTFRDCGGLIPTGGAILNSGTLDANDCVFENCFAGCGGAIRSSGAMIVRRCAFLRNRADQDGGAVECFAGTAMIESCTFLDNFAIDRGGAITVFGSTVAQIGWSTIVENFSNGAGGGVFSSSTAASVTNCIISKNTQAPNMENNLAGSVAQFGKNMIGGDPKLRPLSAYGGEVPYLLPHLYSPAIDVAAAFGAPFSPFDTRGNLRGIGPPDLGAVEVYSYEVTSTAGSAGDPGNTLHAGMSFANNLGSGVLDYIDLRQAEGTISLLEPLPQLSRSVIVLGFDRRIIDGMGARRLFDVGAEGHLILDGLLLKNGFDPSAGGAVLNAGTTIVRQCEFKDNVAGCGGAIRNTSTGDLEVHGCSFFDCSASTDSGAIENLGGSRCVLVNSTFWGNSAARNGGAVASFTGSGRLRVDHCTFCENTAGDEGDSIYLNEGIANVTRSALLDCDSGTPASPMFVRAGTLTRAANYIGAGDGNLAFVPFRTPVRSAHPAPGSPLIDGVDPSVWVDAFDIPAEYREVDQNGNYRGNLGGRDIGAVEYYQDPYLAWVSRHFWRPAQGHVFQLGNVRLPGAERSGDPDGDGLDNEFEIMLGSDPTVPDRHLEPRALVIGSGGSSRPVVEFRDAGNLNSLIEVSTDLRQWQNFSGVAEHQIDPDGVNRTRIDLGRDPSLREFVRIVPNTSQDACASMHYAHVGEPGNLADPQTGRGAVAYTYLIGTYEVTNLQYAAFLNCVDDSGSNLLGLYAEPMSFTGITFDELGTAGSKYLVTPGKETYPVSNVMWLSALRFCNWMSSGSTEHGSYSLIGGGQIPTNLGSISREARAKVVLPTLDEWYKAAFYLPHTDSYALYPTGALTPGMINNVLDSDAFSATYGWSGPEPTGVNTQAISFHGTFDQGGNVGEWSEDSADAIDFYYLGGTYASPETRLRSTEFNANLLAAPQADIFGDIGLRVVRLK